MRRLFLTRDALDDGVTMSMLKWGVVTGRWRRLGHGVYAEGPEEPSDLDLARARVLTRGDAARGLLAGVLHGLDSVSFRETPARLQRLEPRSIIAVDGTPCVNGLQTLVDLAAVLDDLVWEQALESALRKGLTTVGALEDALPALGHARVAGAARIRRVLARRPAGDPPTESLLETLMVQLVRDVPVLPDPVRQYIVHDRHDQFVARVDLAWPHPGLFTELDGQHHKDQPVYDARRETAVVATTGWLPGRFTWTEVTRYPRSTARRLAALAEQAGRPRLGAVIR
jgi:hypothetical protein